MICPRCSNECEDNLLFCSKCGYKINTFIKDNNSDNNISDSEKEIIVGLGTSNNTEFVETAFKTGKVEPTKAKPILNNDFFDDDDDDFDEYIPASRLNNVKPTNLNNSKKIKSKNTKSKNSTVKKSNNKNAGKTNNKKTVMLVVILAVLCVVLAVVITFFVKKGIMTKKFNKYYNQGDVYYTQMNYKEAKTQFINAASNAFTKEQKIKSYEMVYQIDALLGTYVDEEIKYLELLIDVDPYNVEYYKALIVLYQNNNYDSKIEGLKRKAPSSILDQVENFDGTIPVASVEEGSYDKPIEVQLSSMEGLDIYYTLENSNSNDIVIETKYVEPIKIEKEGNYTLKAYSTSESGKTSKELIVKYYVNFNEIKAPDVSLDAGRYYEDQTITVTADPGCSIYYTTTGVTPTVKSKKYKKPINLPNGDSIYYFVAINEDGVSSDVVTRAYSLKPSYSIDYNSALSTLSLALVSKGVLENKYGEFENGNVTYFDYTGIEEIEKETYYIITCDIETKAGVTKSTKIYAVSCDTGECYKAEISGSSYTLDEL